MVRVALSWRGGGGGAGAFPEPLRWAKTVASTGRTEGSGRIRNPQKGPESRTGVEEPGGEVKAALGILQLLGRQECLSLNKGERMGPVFALPGNSPAQWKRLVGFAATPGGAQGVLLAPHSGTPPA